MSTVGVNDKLKDFSTPNNNDFMSTLITPPTISVESHDIIPTFLNLVMKEQISRNFSEDVASHLHKFVEVCTCKNINIENLIM